MPLTLEQISQATQAAFGRLSADVGKISSDVDAGFRVRKEKEAALEAKQAELQARLLETEQTLARRGDPGATGRAYVDVSASLGGLAAGIIEGLQGSNSVRLSVPTASAKRLAVFRAATLTGVDLPGVPLPAVSTYHPQLARLIDLLQARPVKSGNSVSFVRVDYSGDSPGGNQAAKQSSEGAPKAESGIATTPIDQPLATFAHYAKVSKQCLDDAMEMAQILDTILSGGLLDVVDLDIFSVLTTVDNFTAFSATASETVADGVTRIAAQLAQNGGQNISVCLNPADYLGMQLRKASTSGVYLGVPATLAARVVACPAVTSGKLLAFAGAGAQWADREAVNVTAGMVDDSFVRNIVVLLAECRGAVLVRDPGLIAYGNATA